LKSTNRRGAPAKLSVRRGNIFALAPPALILLTLLAYSNSFQAGIVLDNRGLLLHDPRLHEATGANIALIFQHTYWWPNGESGLYRPITTLSYLFNFAILGNGEAPAGYHWINFLLHATNVLLAYALSVRFFRRSWPAFFIAALWAVHPVLTESVTNIAGRADLLAATAVLGGLLAYLEGVEAVGWRQSAWFTGLAAITTVGTFSKESAVVIPAILVLYEITFRHERTWARPKVMGLIATLIPVSLMLYVRHGVLANTLPMEIPFTDNPIAWADFLTGRLTALNVIARYFLLLAWPAHLSADYSWSQIPLTQNWITAIAVLALIPLIVILYRWSRAAFFLFAVGLAWLAPASNLLLPLGTIMAERFLYLTALGFIACAVLAIDALSEKTNTARLAPILLCILTAALAGRTWVRNGDWMNDFTIASANIHTSPQSFKSHDLLANVLFASDPTHTNIDSVLEQSEQSLVILDPLPDDRKPAGPYRFAANCYMLRRAYTKAIPVLLKLISIEKNSVPAFRTNLAARHIPVGNQTELDALERASRQRQSDAYLLLSTAYAESGDATHAADAASHAGQLNPLDPQLYRQMADIASSEGRLDDAAIALVEGAFITSDKSFRQALLELYRTALDPKSCALISTPSGPVINPACPIVHKHVCAASDAVVRTLIAAQQQDLAQTRKKMFIDQFGCPKNSFR
jgi:protein O-mannosyl-transferase